jgi:hypothetical protein
MPNAFVAGIKKAFPFISAAASLGGPFGVMAASVVGKAIGADKPPDGTSEGITNAIATAMADPAQRAALVKADQDFQAQMAELGYKNVEDLEQIAADDRGSARQREMTLKDKVPAVLAATVTVGFFGVLLFMLHYGLPKEGHDALLVMLGSLGSAWGGVITYYFGSSAGSDRKTELLAQAPAIPQK